MKKCVQFHAMKSATPADKNHIINILCKSFNDNFSINYIIKQDQMRMLRMAALMKYSFENCMRFGEVSLYDDEKACGFNKETIDTVFTAWSKSFCTNAETLPSYN